MVYAAKSMENLNGKSQGRPQTLSQQGRVLEAAIQAAATAIISLKDSLNEWDEKVGDGDCGSIMYRGATAIIEDMKQYYPLNDAAETVNEISASIRRAMGGTSGMMYNLLCKAAYAELKANTESEGLKHSSHQYIASVSKYGGATAGYRTMLDALIPASQVLEEKLSAGEDPISAFILSAEAATKGAESTIQMQAQAGRSRYVSAEILATVPDPGAMAAARWYSAAARAVKDSFVPFEGVEKRLQLVFSSTANLRKKLTRTQLEEILKPVECSIEDMISEENVDAYLLSASSLFVFDHLLILKTCGRTKIFECLKKILDLAGHLLESIMYTRGAYMWPQHQAQTHQEFSKEVEVLLGKLNMTDLKEIAKAEMCINNRSWFYINIRDPSAQKTSSVNGLVTVELCMRTLNPYKASAFYKGKNTSMTLASGIGNIFPSSKLHSYEFSPCGYSVNGVMGTAVWTVHVAPEEEVSYASFEICGYEFKDDNSLNEVLGKALACFCPLQFTVAVYSIVPVKGELDLEGYYCKGKREEGFGEGGTIKFYTF